MSQEALGNEETSLSVEHEKKPYEKPLIQFLNANEETHGTQNIES